MHALLTLQLCSDLASPHLCYQLQPHRWWLDIKHHHILIRTIIRPSRSVVPTSFILSFPLIVRPYFNSLRSDSSISISSSHAIVPLFFDLGLLPQLSHNCHSHSIDTKAGSSTIGNITETVRLHHSQVWNKSITSHTMLHPNQIAPVYITAKFLLPPPNSQTPSFRVLSPWPSASISALLPLLAFPLPS